jgi:hypothetical protein
VYWDIEIQFLNFAGLISSLLVHWQQQYNYFFRGFDNYWSIDIYSKYRKIYKRKYFRIQRWVHNGFRLLRIFSKNKVESRFQMCNVITQNLRFVKRILRGIVTFAIMLKAQLLILFFTKLDLMCEKHLQLFLRLMQSQKASLQNKQQNN